MTHWRRPWAARATRRAPLGPLTTYGVGGPAAVLVEIEGPDDLLAVRAVLAERASGDTPVCVVGRGSNLLVADAGFDGVAVHLGRGFNWARFPAPGAEGSPPYTVARRVHRPPFPSWPARRRRRAGPV